MITRFSKVLSWGIILLLIFFIFSSQLNAQTLQEPEDPDEYYLKELKEKDPQAYKQVEKEIELAEKIAEIVSSFEEGKISRNNARNLLFPLVKRSLAHRLGYLDEEITQTAEKLRYLKKIKKEPRILIDEEIDLYLDGSSIK